MGRGAQVGEVDEVALVGEVEGVFEGAALEGAGEVDDRAGRAGDGDGSHRRGLFGGERAAAMQADAGAPLAAGDARDGHVDRARRGGAELPGRGRGVVAEHRVAAERQGRGHPAPFGSQRGVTHGENPAMKGMEPSGRAAALDRLGA